MNDILCPLCNHSINIHHLQGCYKRADQEQKTPGSFCPCHQTAAEIAKYYMEKLKNRIQSLLDSDHQATDEFNAGYQTFESGMELDNAEYLYRSVLPDEVSSHNTFGMGYAWAKFRHEQMAELI